MESPLILAVIGALATLGAGAGFWSAFTLKATKRKLVADAQLAEANTAAVLSQSARDWIERLERRVREAESEADALRRAAEAAAAAAAAARGEVEDLRGAVADLTAVLRSWRTAILHPAATVDRLRLMVTTEEQRNGRT